MENNNNEKYLTFGSLNICGQSGLNVVKQKQIEHFISSYRIDVLACQEINVDNETFSQCRQIRQNYTTVQNNAMNKYGTAFIISNQVNFDHIQCDTEGRIMSVNIGSSTIFNGYLHSGNDRIMKANREHAISETIPNMLQNSCENGLFLADWNCITDNIDATRNQADKMSPSLKRLITTMQCINGRMLSERSTPMT